MEKDLPPVKILLQDNALWVRPAYESIKKLLTIQEKSMEISARTKWQKKSVKTPFEAFVVRVGDDGVSNICTYQGFWESIIKHCEGRYKVEFMDRRLMTYAKKTIDGPHYNLMHGFRGSQEALLKEFLSKDMSGILEAPTRYGKSLCGNAEVLMYDGSTKLAKEVRIGDILVGPDSLPRTVVALGSDEEMSYAIYPERRSVWNCNESHLLSLRDAKDNSLLDPITVKEFIDNGCSVDDYRLWYASVEYPEKELEFDPEESGKSLRNSLKSPSTQNLLKIPKSLFTASIRQRILFLKGLSEKVTLCDKASGVREENISIIRVRWDCNSYPSIMRLCWSVGLPSTTLRDYHLHYANERGIVKSIPLSSIVLPAGLDNPQKCIPQKFRLQKAGIDRYYGFELEGPDKLFLHWDHCVSHNTTLIINTIRAHPTSRIVVTAPGIDLICQTYDDIKAKIPGRDVKKICTGSRVKWQGPDITVCSMDSLGKCDVGGTDLVLIDEPHAAVTKTRQPLLAAFTKARLLAYGATTSGRYDGRDPLIEGLIGPVLARKTYTEAVGEGAICPIHVIFLTWPIGEMHFADRDDAYDALLFHNSYVGEVVKIICQKIIHNDFQTLIFIKKETQAELLMDAIDMDATIAMAKRMSKKEREDVTAQVRDNVIKRCIASDIYVQGVTFHDIRVLINCSAGGNNTTAIQKPGRLAEIRPDKKCGVVIDFAFTPKSLPDYNTGVSYGAPWTFPVRDSQARRTAYTDKGYEIHDVSSLEDMSTLFHRII